MSDKDLTLKMSDILNSPIGNCIGANRKYPHYIEHDSKGEELPYKFVKLEKPTGIPVFGVEVEVENINKVTPSFPNDIWKKDKDNSLRNNGAEFISFPLHYESVLPALALLFDKGLYTSREFSPRTSVHFHMNVMDLTVTELNNILKVYMVVEPLMYDVVGADRHKNIHCVPLNKCKGIVHSLSGISKNPFDMTEFGWHKYTGLNLVPVIHQGTIEFRHMKGTDDMALLERWFKILLSLRECAVENSEELTKEIYSLNTTSDYYAFVGKRFGDLLDAQRLDREAIQKRMEIGVSNVKLIGVNWPPKKIEAKAKFYKLVQGN